MFIADASFIIYIFRLHQYCWCSHFAVPLLCCFPLPLLSADQCQCVPFELNRNNFSLLCHSDSHCRRALWHAICEVICSVFREKTSDKDVFKGPRTTRMVRWSERTTYSMRKWSFVDSECNMCALSVRIKDNSWWIYRLHKWMYMVTLKGTQKEKEKEKKGKCNRVTRRCEANVTEFKLPWPPRDRRLRRESKSSSLKFVRGEKYFFLISSLSLSLTASAHTAVKKAKILLHSPVTQMIVLAEERRREGERRRISKGIILAIHGGHRWARERRRRVNRSSERMHQVKVRKMLWEKEKEERQNKFHNNESHMKLLQLRVYCIHRQVYAALYTVFSRNKVLVWVWECESMWE